MRRRLVRMMFVLLSCRSAYAQAPPSIQFFMPDGSLPPRELRFTLASEDGRVDFFYTDSKGKFLITRSQGLRPDNGYTITVESDGRVYDTTTMSFKLYNVYYIPVFLRPLAPKTSTAGGVINLAEFDARAPHEALEAYAAAMRSLRDNQVEEAIRELERAVKIHPKYFRALNDLGVIYMKLQRLAEAEIALAQAMKIAPRVYYPRLNLAIVRTRQGRHKEAVEILERLHQEDPRLLEARIPLADALMALDRLDEGEAHLRAALADGKLEHATAGDARYKLGLLLNRKQEFAQAAEELAEAAKILPNSARTRLQLGLALVQLKRFDEAERELTESYRIGGAEMGAAQFLLGQIFFTDKRFEKALRAFEQYLADVPQAPNAAEVSSVIQKIRAALKK